MEKGGREKVVLFRLSLSTYHLPKMDTRKIIFGIFAAITIGDWITAMMVKYKQPYFNESNIWYIFTGSMAVVLIVKLIVLGLFWYFYFQRYKVSHAYTRYLWSIFFIIAIIIQMNGTAGNMQEYNREPAEIKPIPEDVRLKSYTTSSHLNWSILLVWAIMFSPFIVYWEFEKWNTKNPL